MTRVDLVNTLRQGVPVTSRLVNVTLKFLEEDRALEARNRELEQACRAMLAGDMEAYRMMRKALGDS